MKNRKQNRQNRNDSCRIKSSSHEDKHVNFKLIKFQDYKFVLGFCFVEKWVKLKKNSGT